MRDRDGARMRVLGAYRILGSAPEPVFERLAKLAALAVGTRWAAISLVGTERVWLKAVVGELDPDTARDGSFCAKAVATRRPVVVPDVDGAGRFGGYRWTEQGVRSYAGWPITLDRNVLGTLCVMDDAPRRLGREDRDVLRLLRDEVACQLKLRRHLLELDDWVRTVAPETHTPVPFEARLANVAAHELNTPLTPILLQVARLRMQELPPEQHDEALSVLERNLERLAAGIRNVLRAALDPGVLRRVHPPVTRPRGRRTTARERPAPQDEATRQAS